MTEKSTLASQEFESSRLDYLIRAQNLLFWVGGAGLVWMGAGLAASDKVAASATCFSVGLLLFLLANLDRIESFKGFGLEAKIRDLKLTMVEAERVIGELTKMRTEVKALAEELTAIETKIAVAKDELNRKIADVEIVAKSAKALSDFTFASTSGHISSAL
jgi:hypothetical protein